MVTLQLLILAMRLVFKGERRHAQRTTVELVAKAVAQLTSAPGQISRCALSQKSVFSAPERDQ